ncbi:hypothetical protein H072_649 [Dactylellina haptotyla CBS 200.50]|uniref:Rhodanese domain-containing protein n=1 Tax=Dactylellina haptotyla (strain CBS 200.50) TaxID=1284197 RepID=S8AR26_DACHA|nr:hypothetical protein H072_649 [Dactylellina haptotyla CBS 200.50]
MASTEAPWHNAFPAPRTTKPESRSREEVLNMLKLTQGSERRDFVIVDVRRNDYEGGSVRGSINLPAQSLYPTIPTLYQLFKAAGVKEIFWYCGSSSGRGTRTAGWFADYIEDKDDVEMKSMILAGGIKGWVAAGGEYTEWMEGYDAAVWSKA